LFAVEVPEIYERIIDIKAIARDAGERAKIAVSSIDDRIDPIGACVGVKGVRVQSVVRELNNERIDIVLYSSNAELFVTRSLAPAKVTALDVYADRQSMTAAVEDEKLSLAIGRGGQNARLASKLTGWKINILSDTEYNLIKRQQVEMAMPIGGLEGVGPKMEERLIEMGIVSVQMLANMTLEDLTDVEGIGEKTAETLLEKARQISNRIQQEYLAQIRQEKAEAAAQLEPGEKPKTGIESLFVSESGVSDDSNKAGEGESGDADSSEEVAEEPDSAEEEKAPAE